MSYVLFIAGFILGAVIGIGAAFLYIQYTVYSQMGKMEDQMQSLMDMDEMEFPDVENVEEKKENENGS